MAFEKKPSSEAPEHAEGEASKKLKKKRNTNEKNTQSAVKRPIKTPVPAEIVAEEARKAEEAAKTKKAKRRSKSKSKSKSSSEISESAAAQESSQVGKQQVKKSARKKAAPEASVSAVSSEAVDTVEESVAPHPEITEDTAKSLELPAEKVIMPQEVDEDEGDIFVSERLLRNSPVSSEQETRVRNQEQLENNSDEKGQRPQATTRTVDSRMENPAINSGVFETPAYVPPFVRRETTDRRVSLFRGEAEQEQRSAATSSQPKKFERFTNKTAERRSLIAGVLLGGIIEHLRHKRREKHIKAAHEKETEKLKDIQNYQQEQLRKQEQKTERVKTELEKRIERLKQQANELSQNKAETRKDPKVTPARERLPEQKTKPPQVSTFYEEFKRKYRTPETSAAASTVIQQPEQKLEQPKAETLKQPAPVPKQREVLDGPVEIPADRRVETSAWHRIEVDKKTGKAVEDPTFVYGEEFQKEQHQEKLRQQIAEASIEAEKVKQAYMPIINQAMNPLTHENQQSQPTATTETHTQLSARKKSMTSMSDTLKNVQNKAGNDYVIDAALWGLLILIIIAIILLL